MQINKSSRHSKITGDFAEGLVLYWLSKYGFECANVDHTGIDIISRNPRTQEIMGISVKSRSRNEGKEGQYVSISNDNFQKAEIACNTFGCIPYFAIVVDEGEDILIFILSMDKLLTLSPKGKTCVSWKMGQKNILQYKSDPEIKMAVFKHQTLSWW